MFRGNHGGFPGRNGTPVRLRSTAGFNKVTVI